MANQYASVVQGPTIYVKNGQYYYGSNSSSAKDATAYPMVVYSIVDLQVVKVSDERVFMHLLSANYALTIGQIPVCNVVPVVGKELTGSEEVIDPSTIFTYGDIVRVDVYYYTNTSKDNKSIKKTVFTGYYTGVAVESDTGGLYGGIKVNAGLSITSSLARLAAYSPSARVFNPGSQIGLNMFIGNTSDASGPARFLNDTIANPKNMRMGEYCVKVSDAMLSWFEGTAKANAQLTLTNDLMVKTPTFYFRPEATTGNAGGMGKIVSDLVHILLTQWADVTAWSFLSMLTKAFNLLLIPTYDGKMLITCNLPMQHTANVDYGGYDLSPADVLRVSITRRIEILHTTQVLVPKNFTTYADKLSAGVEPGKDLTSLQNISARIYARNKDFFYAYPKEPVVKGGAAIVLPMPDLYKRMVDARILQTTTPAASVDSKAKVDTTTNKAAVAASGCLAKANVKPTEKSDEKAKAVATTMGDIIAKLLYGAFCFQERQATIILPGPYPVVGEYNNHGLGSVISFTAPSVKANGRLANNTYVGYVNTVQMEINKQTNTWSRALMVSHVRTTEEDKLTGLDENPLYTG